MDENGKADSDKDESLKVDWLKERLSLSKVLVSFAHETNAVIIRALGVVNRVHLSNEFFKQIGAFVIVTSQLSFLEITKLYMYKCKF
jgi:hypothetical protein